MTEAISVTMATPWTRRRKRAFDEGYADGEDGRALHLIETDSDDEAKARATGYRTGRINAQWWAHVQARKERKHEQHH